MLTLAQICLKEKHVQLAEKALALDLRMKILNNELGELQFMHDSEERLLLPYKLQLLPYLKSLYAFFKQLSTQHDSTEVRVQDLTSYFFKIWSVINCLAVIQESNNEAGDSSSDKILKTNQR